MYMIQPLVAVEVQSHMEQMHQKQKKKRQKQRTRWVDCSPPSQISAEEMRQQTKKKLQ